MKIMKMIVILAATSTAAMACTKERAETDATEIVSTTEVLLASDIQWEKLNPARGDKSPQAGTLWGNRKSTKAPNSDCDSGCSLCSDGPVPTGFLAKFVDGFSSPPHIHNVTYRAVVISGLIHNDDPKAAHMWMTPGSFWTQPKGKVHITSAKGKSTVALVEIDKGPYLVMPPEKAFDSGEKPINVDASNIVWADAPGFPASEKGPKIAYLWGDLKNGHSNGTFLKLPAGFTGMLKCHGSTFRSVVIKGQLQYHEDKVKTLTPGSYLGSTGATTHQLSSKPDEGCTIYIRTNGKYVLTRSQK